MADDINIVIRVRDATRGAIGRVERDLARLQTRLRASSRDSNVFDRLGTRLRSVQDHLNRSTAFVGRFRGALNRVAASGLTPLARASDYMGNRMRRVFGDASRWVGTLRGNLTRMGPTLTRLGGLFTSMGNRIAHAGRMVHILLLVLALIGPAAQAIGALLITALAGAFIALGAYALRGSAQVKGAFQDMKSTIGSVVRAAAQPLEGPLVQAMNGIRDAARGMGPMLHDAFEATAPLVSDFSTGITNLAVGALPGLVAALRNAGPAMDGFKTAMGDVGQGIGDMFKEMTKGDAAEGLQRAWQTLGVEMQNLLTNIGQFIATMSNSASATTLFIGIFRTFSGVLHVIEVVFQSIDEVAGGLFQHINSWVTGMSGLTGASKNAADSFAYMGKSTTELKKELEDSNQAIANYKKQLADVDSSSLPGSMKKDRKSAINHDLNMTLKQRSLILSALKALSLDNAGATNQETSAINGLIAATNKLNEANLSRLDKKAALEQSIDDATKSYKGLTHALKMHNGQLDLGTQKARDAYNAVSGIAKAGNDLGKSLSDQKASWQDQIANWNESTTAITRALTAMGLGKQQAAELAASMLQIPNVAPKIKADITDLQSKLNTAKAELKNVPDSRKAQVKAQIADLQRKLAQARSALKSLDGATANTYINNTTRNKTINETIYHTSGSLHDVVGGATGGMFTGSGFKHGFASGGKVTGPGTGTSDDIPAPWLSNGEFVMREAAVRKYGERFMQAINSGRLKVTGYAKGGKVSKAAKAAAAQRASEKEARGQAVGDLTISHFGKMAGYKNDEFRTALAKPNALGSLVDTLNQWRNTILKATHGGVEKGLLKSLDKAGKSLLTYDKKLAQVNTSLDKAKTHLNDLKSAAASLKESVTSGVMTATDITGVASSDTNVTMSDIMTKMSQSKDQAKAFSDALARLQSKGVSKDIINQIAQAGISGGGLQTAGALLSASSGEIANINDMQKQINASAASAGKTASDAMYAAGIKAAEGLVKGLTKKKTDIETAMMNIAKSMEKAIKKALKIKSPSKVMQDVGHYTAEGFAVGVEKNKRVDSAWESMLTTSGSSGSSRGGSGTGEYVINLNIGGKPFEQIVLDTNRRIVRTRGGNVQAVFGRKTS